MENKDYRPVEIQFDVDGGQMPATMCKEFQESKDAVEFMAKYLTSINTKARVHRLMDLHEKKMIREDYQDLLEQKIPMLEKELFKAKQTYDEAKKAYNDMLEFVNATTNEAKSLALEVKRGVKEIELDDLFTWRVPVGEKYFIYTYIDNQIKLCKVLDIPFHEKNDLFNAMHKNEEFFNSYYPGGLICEEKFNETVEENAIPDGKVKQEKRPKK